MENTKKYKVQKSRIFIDPEWYEKPSYLKGDLALIHVPGLRRGKNFVPIELPSLSYYPNGKSSKEVQRMKYKGKIHVSCISMK